jgi:MerR family transcriptional regulator, heat shock protein HspR
VTTIPAPHPPQPPVPASNGSTGVYGITVAAELAGMSVQALRFYERRGLLAPARTWGGVRRYSDADIARLRRIGTLIAEGINLTGIARVLGLEADNADLHADNEGLRARNAHLRTANTTLRGGSMATGHHPPAERPTRGT